MGVVVYRAQDIRLGRFVALKFQVNKQLFLDTIRAPQDQASRRSIYTFGHCKVDSVAVYCLVTFLPTLLFPPQGGNISGIQGGRLTQVPQRPDHAYGYFHCFNRAVHLVLLSTAYVIPLPDRGGGCITAKSCGPTSMSALS